MILEHIHELMRAITKESDDPRVQIGAIIVDRFGEVKGIGTNRLPNEIRPRNIPNWPTNKHLYLNHAEDEAILEALITCREVANGSMYVNAFPCASCAKSILKVGIRRVIVLPGPVLKFEWQESQNAARLLFNLRGVEVVE